MMTDQFGDAAPDTTAGERAGRDPQGRFAPGNPGRPHGARHAALVALDAIGAEGAERVLRRVMEMAEGGDIQAAALLLRRVWPERKGRSVVLDLPPLTGAHNLPAVMGAITSAVATGEITPDEGQDVAGVVELHRRAIETAELEQRIAALEAKKHR